MVKMRWVLENRFSDRTCSGPSEEALPVIYEAGADQGPGRPRRINSCTYMKNEVGLQNQLDLLVYIASFILSGTISINILLNYNSFYCESFLSPHIFDMDPMYLSDRMCSGQATLNLPYPVILNGIEWPTVNL
jgi:hypothetical protein